MANARKRAGLRFSSVKLQEALKGVRIEVPSAALEVSHGTVANWLKGRTVPSADQLARLARYLDQPMESFFTTE